MNIRILPLACLSLALFLSCGPGPSAGGSSEETNAIAGIVVDGQGKPVANAWVEVRPSQEYYQPSVVMKTQGRSLPVSLSPTVLRDTTDSEGRWLLQTGKPGSFTVLAGDSKGRLLLRKVSLEDKLQLVDTLHAAVSFQTKVNSRWSLPQGILAVVPGTLFHSSTDSAGMLRFDSLPQGTYDLLVKSGDTFRYADIQVTLALRQNQAAQMWGPYDSDAVLDSSSRASLMTNAAAFAEDSVVLPLRYEYGVRAWWEMERLKADGGFQFFTDSRARAEQGVVYGGTVVPGIFGKGLHFDGESQFGVIESAGTVFDSLEAFSIELWFKLDSLPSGESFQRNLFGQLAMSGDSSSDLFSIALVKGPAQNLAVGFLLSDGHSGALSVENRVVSKVAIKANAWNYVLATWDGGQACVFVNASSASCRELALTDFVKSKEPLYFGKENLPVVLDEIRIVDINMDGNDARYRWLRRLQ